MRRLIEHLRWWLANSEGMDIPVPRELADQVMNEIMAESMRHGPSPRPAAESPTSGELVQPGG